MLKIQIKDASVAEREVRGKNGTFTSREQAGWVEFPSGEVRRVRVGLPRGAEPYRVGTYTVGLASYTVGQWGDLELQRQLELVPVAASGAANKAA